MALGAVVVTLVLCEIGLRVLNVKPERYPRPRWQVWVQGAFRESNILGHGLIKQPSRFEQSGLVMGEYVPGAMFRCVYASNPRGYFDPDSGVTMSVDSWGMRKRETDCAKEKSRGICRVLLLGDSFTFGVGVRDSDTFARRMEERINAVPAPSPRCEVLNAGVQGYNTRDEVLCLEGQWLKFSPDVVLIVFYINDAYDGAAIFNNGEALGIYAEQPPGMARVSRLWDIAQHNIRARRASKDVEEFYRKSFFSSAESFLEKPGDVRVDWTTGKNALARAAMLSKERSFSLGLVIFPDL